MIDNSSITDLRNKIFTGVVEQVSDQYKRGKIKVRVNRVYDTLPIADIPWAVFHDQQALGKSHLVPEIGKVVKVVFPEGDWYRPEYFCSFHYNINLQKKLESLTDSDYTKFSSPYFDDQHQYYLHPTDGMMFDYVKSHLNIKPNGDIRIALRDSSSYLYIGSDDGDQPILMSDHWMKWFDKLVNNLMGSNGGPYFGNMGAPVLANPALLDVLNEYYAIRQTFLSTNLWAVDNNNIKAQSRAFDNTQRNDNTSTNVVSQPIPTTSGYQPVAAPPAKAAKQPGAPNNIANSTLPEPSEILPSPIAGPYQNGQLPLANLTQSVYLKNANSNLTNKNGGLDTESYLIDAAATAFDNWMALYNQEKDITWPDIIFTDGYRTLERQQGMYTNNPTIAPKPGTSDHGWAISVDMYWGADPSIPASIDVNTASATSTSINDQVYYWLKTNGATYGFANDVDGTQNITYWWNWTYTTPATS
jgi:hypothetical protein